MNTLKRTVFTSGTLLIGSIVVNNFINFVYNAYLGRSLEFSTFALVTLANSIWYLFNFVLSALSATMNHRVAYVSARMGSSEGIQFYRYIRRRARLFILLASLAWIVAAPITARYFRLSSLALVLAFAPVIATSTYAAIFKGTLTGRFKFQYVAIASFVETLAKLGLAVFFMSIHQPGLVYLSIPLSIIIGFTLLSIFTTISMPAIIKPAKHSFRFPREFFLASFVTGFSATAFLTLDVLLTKHYFYPTVAGTYALLALVGKMVFFFGSLFTVFTIPFTSREMGTRRDPHHAFNLIFLAGCALTGLMTAIIGIFGGVVLPHLFGAKIYAITPYLPLYTLAIGLYTVADSVVGYHLARKHYVFPALGLFYTFVMCIGIVMYHSGIQAVVNVILITSIANFATLVPLHLARRDGRFLLSNIIDLAELFSGRIKTPRIKKGGMRILIYNWRDMRHTYAGGAEVYVHELARRWVAAGNSVTVFSGNDGRAARHEMMDGVHVIRRGGFYTVYIWAFVYYMMRFKGRYDIIIDSENGIPFFTPLYAGQTTFLLMHHVHQEVFRRSLKPPLSWIAEILEIHLMPIVYRHTQFITVSPSTKREIEKQGLTSITPYLIYNGVDLNRYKPGVRATTPTVLYLGRLKEYKSVDTYIRAAAQVRKNNPDVEFIIAGTGEEEHKLRALSESLGNPVTFMGHVTEDEKIALYQRAWTLVNPSFMEGWGITTIEANACGTPVIASAVPGLSDSIRDGYNGVLFPYKNDNILAREITHMITDTRRLNRMSEHSVTWAAKYDWDASAARGLKFFQDVTSYKRRYELLRIDPSYGN